MTLQLAKERRVDALSRLDSDRILVEPADHYSQVHLPDEDTVAGYLIDALGHGCRIEQLETETGWSKATIITNLYKVAKKSGVGIHRRAHKLHLLLPRGAGHIYPRPKIVSNGSTAKTVGSNTVDMERSSRDIAG